MGQKGKNPIFKKTRQKTGQPFKPFLNAREMGVIRKSHL
jgi:hypothetical protein